MPASAKFVDDLFAMLAARYGSQWLSKWDGMDMVKVASVWADELGGFKLRHIKYALANLPRKHPPNAMEFKDLCLLAPEPPVAMLADATRKPDPRRLAEILATIPRGAQRNPLACAQRHLERLKAGEKLTPAQRELVRAALPHAAIQCSEESIE